MIRMWRPFAAALVPLAMLAQPANAAEPSSALFAGYWSDFIAHWEGVFQQQNGIAMGVVGVGIVALFIITRGKWQK